MTTVKIILGSTRPNRFGIHPTNWLKELAKEHPETNFEVVDLFDLNLPLLDEPNMPSAGNYEKEHTKKWSKIIDEADGFVFVTAEYNHSIPAAFKNAIDFLGKEWHYKPVAFLGYGASAGGLRAIEAWRLTLSNLHVYTLKDELAFVNYWELLTEDGTFVPSERKVKAAHELLKNIGFWAKKLKPIREELQIH